MKRTYKKKAAQGAAAVAAIQCVRFYLIAAGPWYVVLRSTLKSYLTQVKIFFQDPFYEINPNSLLNFMYLGLSLSFVNLVKIYKQKHNYLPLTPQHQSRASYAQMTKVVCGL